MNAEKVFQSAIEASEQAQSPIVSLKIAREYGKALLSLNKPTEALVQFKRAFSTTQSELIMDLKYYISRCHFDLRDYQ